MSQLVKTIERGFLKKEIPDFRPGDTVRVAVRIVEGDKERVQNFEGIVIARRGGGLSQTFKVRRVSFGVGMERTFTLHSPRVESIRVLRHGRVRRAKLFYLRDLSGRKARIADTRRKRHGKDRMIQLLQADGVFQDPPDATASAEAPDASAEPAAAAESGEERSAKSEKDETKSE
jgi:large subunit ribosomal protein L19